MTNFLSLSRHSPEPGASTTPTLHDEPVDVPLKEKSAHKTDPEASPDNDIGVHTDSASSRTGAGDDAGASDVLLVDWNGPDDPENPKK